MRRIRRSGSFLMCFLINLLLNLEWALPSLMLLLLHVWLGISIWWFVGSVGLWLLSILAGMWLMGWTADCSSQKDPPKENKNPYSVRNKK